MEENRRLALERKRKSMQTMAVPAVDPSEETTGKRQKTKEVDDDITKHVAKVVDAQG